MFDFLIVLLIMFFFHIVDDFYMQGILAKLKQKTWWEENAPEKMYKNDYKISLAIHAFSWCVSIHIPIVAFAYIRGLEISAVPFVINFAMQTALHAIVDTAKANDLSINLTTDQLIHAAQIVVAYVWVMCCMK